MQYRVCCASRDAWMFNPDSGFHVMASSQIGFPVSGQEYQVPEEIWLGPAVHGCLKAFDAVHVPSTGPELNCIVSPAVTACRSPRNPALNDRSFGRSASTASIHPVRVSLSPNRS